MNIKRTYAIVRKEIIQIRRDPLSLTFAFLLPAVMLFLYGYAISLDVNNIKTIIYDRDKSKLSREFVDMLTQSGYFSVIKYIDSQKEIDRYLDAGKASVAISIPYDFSRNIKSGKMIQLQAIVDGTDSNNATISSGYISVISEMYSQKLNRNKFTPLIDPRIRIWYNSDLKSRNFIIPGLIAVIMAIIAALLTSLCIAREWERGTMEQLISTPIKSPELILGKLIPYFLIGLIDVFVSVVLSVYLFKIPLRGSFFLLTFVSSIFLFGGLGLGILISISTRSQLLSSQIAMISTFLPAFLLSGFIFSIFNMPKILQIITYIVPARYFVSAIKAIYLKGSGFHFLLYDILLLIAYGLIVFILANKKFKKRIL